MLKSTGCRNVDACGCMQVHDNSFITDNSVFGASINTTENQICVSCPDDGVSRGCVIVLRYTQQLQSTMSHIIPKAGIRCFYQEQNGDYTIAVFKQTMNKTLHAIPSALNASVVSLYFSTPTRKLSDAWLVVHTQWVKFVPWSFSKHIFKLANAERDRNL